MAMGLKSGVRAGLPKVLKGSPRLNMARASAINNRRGSRNLIELEFFTSQVWTVPPGVRSLARLIGQGGAGSPGGIGTVYDQYSIVYVTYDSPAYGEDSNQTTYMGEVYSDPGYYCDPSVYYPNEHATLQYCYEFQPKDVYYPPSAGANTTAFDRTFPGGAGGPAAPVEYRGVPALAGSNLSLIIPMGGFIKIAYLAR